MGLLSCFSPRQRGRLSSKPQHRRDVIIECFTDALVKVERDHPQVDNIKLSKALEKYLSELKKSFGDILRDCEQASNTTPGFALAAVWMESALTQKISYLQAKSRNMRNERAYWFCVLTLTFFITNWERELGTALDEIKKKLPKSLDQLWAELQKARVVRTFHVADGQDEPQMTSWVRSRLGKHDEIDPNCRIVDLLCMEILFKNLHNSVLSHVRNMDRIVAMLLHAVHESTCSNNHDFIDQLTFERAVIAKCSTLGTRDVMKEIEKQISFSRNTVSKATLFSGQLIELAHSIYREEQSIGVHEEHYKYQTKELWTAHLDTLEFVHRLEFLPSNIHKQMPCLRHGIFDLELFRKEFTEFLRNAWIRSNPAEFESMCEYFKSGEPRLTLAEKEFAVVMTLIDAGRERLWRLLSKRGCEKPQRTTDTELWAAVDFPLATLLGTGVRSQAPPCEILLADPVNSPKGIEQLKQDNPRQLEINPAVLQRLLLHHGDGAVFNRQGSTCALSLDLPRRRVAFVDDDSSASPSKGSASQPSKIDALRSTAKSDEEQMSGLLDSLTFRETVSTADTPATQPGGSSPKKSRRDSQKLSEDKDKTKDKDKEKQRKRSTASSKDAEDDKEKRKRSSPKEADDDKEKRKRSSSKEADNDKEKHKRSKSKEQVTNSSRARVRGNTVKF